MPYTVKTLQPHMCFVSVVFKTGADVEKEDLLEHIAATNQMCGSTLLAVYCLGVLAHSKN